jgi:hypothetical protein
MQVLRNMVTYVVLAPYAPEQWDLVNRVIADKLLQQLPFYKYGEGVGGTTGVGVFKVLAVNLP